MTKRIRLEIEYDGTAYGGWQYQLNAPTVQEEVEKALLELTGEKIRVTGASRTDAGVHARAQVAHFDTESQIPAERFSYALNTLLPKDIRVQESSEAPADFHARFWTRGKEYSYMIWNNTHASALLADRAWCIYPQLDVEKMREAAQLLKGEHDFRAFCATGGQTKTTVRTIHEIRVEEKEPHLVTIRVSGNAFLYNMVRIIAGTLADIGTGRLPVDTVTRMLETGDRTIGGPTAPAQGLTLERIDYYETKPDWVR